MTTRRPSPALVVAVVALLIAVAVVVILKRGGHKPAARGKRKITPASGRRVTERSASLPPEAGVAIDDEPTGGLLLEGLVVDAQDKPVAGARVAVDAHPRREVKSGEDGSFAIDGLLAREYTIEAHADAGHAGPVAARLTATSDPVILRLGPAGALEVTVTDAGTRQPIAGAQVALRGTLILSAETDAAGKATLQGVGAEWVPLVVTAAGYAPARRIVETLGTPGAVQRQAFELQHGAGVSGVVVDGAGKPIAGARVLADDASDPFPTVDPRDDAVTTGADGAWRFDALPPGTFRFLASHATFAPGTSPPITLDGVTARSGVEIRLDAGATLSGRVLTPDGAPVAGAAVRIALRDGGFAWHLTRQATSGEDGRYQAAGLPARTVSVVAQAEAASSAVVTVDLSGGGGAKPVDLILDVGGTIAGTVVSPSGEPIAEAQLLAEPEWNGSIEERRDWRLRTLPAEVSDTGGGFRFTGLPPGPYRLRAARPGTDLWLRSGTPAKTGDLSVRLVLAADGKVKGQVLYADGSAPASFMVALGGATPVPFAGDQGRFQLSAPGGPISAAVTGPTFERKVVQVEIKEGGETDLGTITVEKGRSISGRVLDGGGSPVAGARVAAGWLLTGTGSELNVPDEGFGVHETTTGADGVFVVTGLGEAPGALVAQGTGGRARSAAVPAGAASVQIDLILGQTGSLDGKITQGGAPLASAVILASPRSAQRSVFFVMSGPDGSYRFDTLAADEYTVSVMIGGGGPRPKDVHARTAIVPAGGSGHADIDVPRGDGSLRVTVSGEGGAQVAMARVFAGAGHLEAAATKGLTAGQLRDVAGMRGDSSTFMRDAVAGKPATFEGLVPGPYTVCAIAVGSMDPAVMQQLGQRMDTMPIGCGFVEVAGAGTELALTAPVFTP